MKNRFIIILLIAVSYCHAQKTEVILDVANNLSLKWNKKERLSEGTASLPNSHSIKTKYRVINDVTLLWLQLNREEGNANDVAGIFFKDASMYKKGVALWRYKPWNSWTKPIPLEAASKMPEDDVQFFYW